MLACRAYRCGRLSQLNSAKHTGTRPCIPSLSTYCFDGDQNSSVSSMHQSPGEWDCLFSHASQCTSWSDGMSGRHQVLKHIIPSNLYIYSGLQIPCPQHIIITPCLSNLRSTVCKHFNHFCTNPSTNISVTSICSIADQLQKFSLVHGFGLRCQLLVE